MTILLINVQNHDANRYAMNGSESALAFKKKQQKQSEPLLLCADPTDFLSVCLAKAATERMRFTKETGSVTGYWSSSPNVNNNNNNNNSNNAWLVNFNHGNDNINNRGNNNHVRLVRGGE